MMKVHSIPGAFTARECEQIVASSKRVPANDALLVGQNRDHNLRKCDVTWLDDVTGTGWVMARLISLVRRSNTDRFDFDLREFSESPQVALYKASDGGHFAWHSDVGDGHTARKRKLTLVVQLSKPGMYDGGDLEIMPDAYAVTASRYQGSATVFPSFLLHQVTPVEQGERYSLTVWAHGPAFR
ncbi:2OG-Fe(II) oxygenase [Ruegeria denitrificans]|nr:2OG-Fe(II) oxygenase [Ruegeria denitrificans]